MTDDAELKPCPECGHDGKGVCYDMGHVCLVGIEPPKVVCLACGFEGQPAPSMADAAALWNGLAPAKSEDA